MKLINGKAYLTIQEVVECGITTEANLRTAKSQGRNCWDFMDDPADKRKVLVGYEALNDYRKELVQRRFGNPYTMLARRPIADMVVNDPKVNSYFMGYQFDTDKRLPVLKVFMYTREAAWLAFINRVLVNKKAIVKEQLGIDKMPDFFDHVSELVKLEKERGKMPGYAGIDVLPGDFPTTAQRMCERAKRYAMEGNDMLIDPMYGNKNGAKIGKVGANVEDKRGVYAPEREADQLAVIRAVAANGNNLDAGQVAKVANSFFAEKGMKTVSTRTINRFINKNIHLLTTGRNGAKAHSNSVAMQVRRKVTPHPLMYWTLDGWTVELIYQERGAKGVEYKRLVAVIVLDPWQKYPIGYAIGDRETPDLIREACRNAIIHTRELFGQPYRPWQMQSDNYAIKNLTPFYQAMAHLHTPAAVGNAKAKVIEPYFKDLNKNYCQFMNNWSGFNVTARKETQVNVEQLNKLKKNFPDRDGVERQIHAIMQQERKNKHEAYVATFLGADQYEVMTDMAWLEVFGQALGKRTNTLAGEGIVKQIDGEKFVFDSFEPGFRENMNTDWMLYGDPMDLTRVLAVSPDEKLRFVLEQKRAIPMDVRSQTEADRQYRAAIEGYNNELKEYVELVNDSDADRTREIMDGTPFRLMASEELALKGMFIVNGQQKDGLQDAKRLGSLTPALSKGEGGGARKTKKPVMTEEQVNWQALQDARMNAVLAQAEQMDWTND
jgi:hypothetical protein